MIGSYLSIMGARYLGLTIRQMPLVYLDVTDRCTSRCRTCHIWKHDAAVGDELATDRWLALIPAMQKLRARVVSLGGGEPSLRDDLDVLVSRFCRAGLRVHMNTNAIGPFGDRIAALKAAGLSALTVSCDHVTAEGYRQVRGVDGLAAVAQAILRAQEVPHPVAVSVNVVVSKLNVDMLEAIAKQCIEWSVHAVQFIPAQGGLQQRDMAQADLADVCLSPDDGVRTRDALARAVQALHKAGVITNSRWYLDHFMAFCAPARPLPCFAGFVSITVDSAGNVWPCYAHAAQGMNVCERALDEIVCSRAYRRALREVRRCRFTCWDVGSAEPSILLHPGYLARHPREAWKKVRSV